jgi:serine/threonine-protein kinase
MDDREKREEISLSISTSPVAPLLQSRVLDVPAYPGLLASLDRLEILEVLGSGGMGVVLLARDPTRPAPVAIKVLRPELVSEPRAVHRFLVEARHMQRLSHPHVLPVLEVSDRTEGPYFVVPYMAGGSLSKVIQPGKPLPPDRILEIATHMAEALAFAHTRGLTHRDLKPGNVLLDNLGNAYLSDFGLVRTVYNDSLLDVRRHQTEGTPAYMPPEIARGEAGDTRADIYSLGALMYEMLTGEPPYEGPSPQQILEQVKNTVPRSILSRNPDAHLGLAKIAETAMARELPERYVSMQQMLEDLQRIAVGTAAAGVKRRLLSPRRSKWLWRAMGVLVVTCAIVITYSRLRGPSNQFRSIPLTLNYWSTGSDQVRYQDHEGSTGSGSSVFRDAKCLIRATAESANGYAIREYAWIDFKEDVRGRGDSEFELTIDKPDATHLASVQVCNGAKPSESDWRAVELFRVNSGETTKGSTTVTIRFHPSLPAALVTETGDLNDATFVDLTPIRGAVRWHLRLICEAPASGDTRRAQGLLDVSAAAVRTSPANSGAVVYGRVTHELSGDGIGGVSVRSLDSARRKRTSPDGFYWLPLSVGQHQIAFEHHSYKAPTTQTVTIGESEHRELNQILANSTASPGQVTKVIHVDRPLGGPGFLPRENGVVCVTRDPSGDCRLSLLATSGEPPMTQWKILAALRADGNREKQRQTCSSTGMAENGNHLYSIETWTARLMTLDVDKGVVESRVIPNLEWTQGLGIDGDCFWTLELDVGRGVFRILLIHMPSLQIRVATRCPPDALGLAFGNGKLWISRSGDGGHVAEVDPAKLRATGSFEQSVVDEFDGNYLSLAFVQGELWGWCEQTSRFCRIYIRP